MSTAPPVAEPAGFEAALAELEQLVRELEDGQLGLEQALDRYERSVTLLKHCYGMLQKAEQRVMVLTGVDQAGQPIIASFEPAAMDSDGNPRPPPEASGKRRAKEADDAPERPLLF